MTYLTKYYEFDTVEEGEKQLAEAVKVQKSMIGWLYSSILADECGQIYEKLEKLRRERWQRRE